MATGFALPLALAALVGLGGAAYLLLETTTVTSVSLGGDGACDGMRMEGEHRPTRPADREATLTLQDGVATTIDKWAGVWHARLEAEGARIAEVRPGEGARPAWTSTMELGWCLHEAQTATFVAQGNGTLHVRAWAGEGDGFTVQ